MEGEENKKQTTMTIDEDALNAKMQEEQKRLIDEIKRLEDELRELEKEDERDIENEQSSKKPFKISLDIIPDHIWKAIVAVVGIFLIGVLVVITLEQIDIALSAAEPAEGDDALAEDDPSAADDGGASDPSGADGGARRLENSRLHLNTISKQKEIERMKQYQRKQ